MTGVFLWTFMEFETLIRKSVCGIEMHATNKVTGATSSKKVEYRPVQSESDHLWHDGLP